MDFRILGPLRAFDGDRPIPLSGAKQRALLAMLLVEANRVVSTDRLSTVSGVTTRRRRRRRPCRSTSHAFERRWSRDGHRATPGRSSSPTRPAISYAPSRASDLDRFEKLASSAEARACDRRPASRCRPAPDHGCKVDRAPACRPRVRGLRAPRDRAARGTPARRCRRQDRCRSRARSARASRRRAEALVSEHPHRERLRCLLVLALYRSGRQAEALEAFQDAKRELLEEAGIEPSPALARLERSILTQDPSLELEIDPEPALVEEPEEVAHTATPEPDHPRETRKVVTVVFTDIAESRRSESSSIPNGSVASWVGTSTRSRERSASRRNRREIRRRCRPCRLRDPVPPRGRRTSRSPGGDRRQRGPRRAERRVERDWGGSDRDPNRRQHGRGGGRQRIAGRVVRHGQRGQRRLPSGASSPPRGILIGQETYSLVRDAVEVESIAPLTLKGVSAAVAAFRLLAVVPGVPGRARDPIRR